MTIHPNSSFPLLASDQDEVIRIFLELMQNHDHIESAPEPKKVFKRFTQPADSEESFFPGDTFDYE